MLVLLALWQLLYDRTDFLPAPSEWLDTTVEYLQEGDTWDSLFATSRRLVLGLGMGYVGGVALALVMRQSTWWRGLLKPYVFVALTTPSLSVSLISLMVFGLSEVGVYIAVAAVVFPFVVISLSDGLDHLDARLGEMAKAYKLGWVARTRHLTLPELAPYLFAAFRNVHALAWKIVVVAELFSQETGVGVEYKNAYEFFKLDRLLAWALFFVAMVMIVEYGILRRFERVVFRWRQA